MEADGLSFNFVIKYSRVTKNSKLLQVLSAVRSSPSRVHLAIPKAIMFVEDGNGTLIIEIYKRYKTTLDRIIEGLTLKTSLLYYSAIIKALSALHKMGFIHADLKPDNIAISENNVLKLIDYGNSMMDRKTMSSKPGNPSYDTNKPMLGPEHEVFAATNILAEMLTGGSIDCSTEEAEEESTKSVLAALRAKYGGSDLLELVKTVLEDKKPRNTDMILRHPLLGAKPKAYLLSEKAAGI